MTKVRSVGARLGATALNLIMPGLGLLRVGSGRLGAALALLPLCWMMGSIVVFAVTPRATFGGIVTYLALTILIIVAIYFAAITLTWRRSALQRAPRWFGRWYVLAGLALATSLLSNNAVEGAHRFYKPFYLPAESMAPTLGKLDRIVADMRPIGHPAIGDLVLAPSRSAVYVKRVVALPGDRISMVGDVPIINGVAARIKPAGFSSFLDTNGSEPGERFHEQLPGEIGHHDIFITQRTDYGDLTERTVPPGHVFLLGDNRERSADSRWLLDMDGLGMVEISRLAGRPLYITWPHRSGKIGQPIHH